MSNLKKEDKKNIKVLISQAKAIERTMVEIQNHSNNVGFNYSSCVDFAKKYQFLVNQSIKYIKVEGMLEQYDINKIPNQYDMIGLEQMTLFQSVLTSTRLLISLLESNFDYADDEFDCIEDIIVSKLRKLFIDKPTSEKEVQDNLERLFIASNMNKGIDYDRETGKFKFSSREYIPDFILPKLNCCIEVKIIKEKSHLSKMIEEINADVTAYSKKYEKIIFVVYDLGFIRDTLEFKRDIELSKENDIKVIVIKH